MTMLTLLDQGPIAVVSWLATYALHSTLLLGAAALATRVIRAEEWRETLWKAALIGGLFTATLQVALEVPTVAGEWALPPGLSAPAEGLAMEGSAHRVIEGSADRVRSSAAQRELQAGAGQTGGSAEAAADPALWAPAAPLERAEPADPTVGSPSPSPVPPLSDGRDPAGFPPALWLVLAWGLGSGLLLSRLVRRHARLTWILRERRPVRDPSVLRLLAELQRSAGVWRPIRLTEDRACPTPLALGASEICVPRRFLGELDDEQKRSALAHELAHVARRDPAWHLLVSVLESLFFFQPLNRVARSRLRESAEHLADDWAVRQTGSPLGLARCLAEVASWVGPPIPSGTLAMAEGGSPLLRRVERLLQGRHAPQPTRRTWAVTLALGMVTSVAAAAPAVTRGGDAAARTEKPAELGTASAEAAVAADAPTLPLARPTSGLPEPSSLQSKTQPEVIRHPDPSAPLPARWSWATAEAERRGHSGYWVAYAIERPLERGRILVEDSHGWHTDEWGDPSLATLLLGRAVARPAEGAGAVSQPIVILFRLGGGGGVERIAARSAAVGMALDGDPVYWLGAASQAESFDWLAAQAERLDEERLQSTAVELVALHEDSERVVPFLEGVIRGHPSPKVRVEAVEGLEWHPVPRSVAILRATALADGDLELRSEAAETLGELATPDADPALVEVVRSGSPARVREEALEGMGERGTPGLLEELSRVVTQDPDPRMQEEAVEAIAEFPADRSAPALERIARTHDDPRIREEAVEALADLDPGAAAGVLEALLQDEGLPEGMRKEALEGLADQRTPGALEAIFSAALSDPSPTVQQEAVEALAEFPSGQAAPRLERIIWEHPRSAVRREAVEAVADLSPSVALPILDRVLAEHEDVAALMEAVDALEEMPDAEAVPRLRILAREHARAEVRREARDQLEDREPEVTGRGL